MSEGLSKSTMKTKIDPKWMELELQHVSGGDGFGIVEVLDDEYVRVGWPRGTQENAHRAWLAWVKRLSPTMRRKFPNRPVGDDNPLVEQPFDDAIMVKLNALREDILSGKKKVVSTYIVPVWLRSRKMGKLKEEKP